jgi:PAS domain S-box-containing protein
MAPSCRAPASTPAWWQSQLHAYHWAIPGAQCLGCQPLHPRFRQQRCRLRAVVKLPATPARRTGTHRRRAAGQPAGVQLTQRTRPLRSLRPRLDRQLDLARSGVLQMHERTTHAYAQVEAQAGAPVADPRPDPRIGADHHGLHHQLEPGRRALFGYSALEAVGRNILFLYADEDGQRPDAFAEQGGRMMEVRRRKKSGEVFWASLSLSPLRDLDDKPVGLIAYLTDITERKLAEERLHHLAYYQELTGLPNRTPVRAPGRPGPDGRPAQRNARLRAVPRPEPLQADQRHPGPQVGDELLRQVAQRFRNALRDEDVVAHLRRRIRRRPVRHPPALRSHHGRAEAAGRAGHAVPHRRPRPARGRQRRHQRLPAGRPGRRNPAAHGRHRDGRAKEERETRTTASPSTAST